MNHYNTYYNPQTNEISRRRREGFESCGSRKFAEAMTHVSEDLRFELWSKTNTSEYRGIPLEEFSSKLQHQLRQIGIKSLPKTQYYKRNYTPGLDLLRKIMKK